MDKVLSPPDVEQVVATEGAMGQQCCKVEDEVVGKDLLLEGMLSNPKRLFECELCQIVPSGVQCSSIYNALLDFTWLELWVTKHVTFVKEFFADYILVPRLI